ncbi:MAG: mechanosensitive ion channel [Halobacteriota archaeon]|nr:mechanosensitive ion channel [Halobacteriota archaeon]
MVDISTIFEWQYIDYLIAFLIVILTIMVARICIFIFERYLEKFAAKTKTRIDDIIIKAIKGPVYVVVTFLGIYIALSFVDFPYMDQAEMFFDILNVILLTWIAYRVSGIIIKEYGYSLADKTESQIDDVIIPVIDQIAQILIVIIGILVIFDLLGIKITPMLAGMGIAGIAVALAAQETLANTFSGFTLMVDRPFKLGDRIILDTGEICEVRDVGLRSTRLYNVIEHTLISIPNAELSKMKITNISAPDLKLKVKISIGVAYGSDIDKVKGILLDISEEAPEILNDPTPDVRFMEFDDCSLNLNLFVWISDIRKKIEVIDFVNCRIKERFEEENIEIPFPIRTVYMAK